MPKKLNGRQLVFVKYRTRYPTIEELTNWNAVEHLDLSVSIRFFFFARLSNDWSTLGLLAVDSYLFSNVLFIDASMRLQGLQASVCIPLGSSRTARFALFGYREFQQRNRRISVSIGGPFLFRVEWLLTTCRWIDSKKIRSLRIREMFCTFVRNLKMQGIPRLKIFANETNVYWTP